MAAEGEPHYLQVLYKDLALALGNAVWAFARIEWLTYEYLGRLSADHLDELVGDVSYRARTSILRRIVERSDANTEKKERALAAIKQAESLAEKRNIIVHNPWRIWVDLDAKDFMTEIQKCSNPTKKVDLSELQEFAASAEKIEVELRDSLNAL
jgi:hypothetical protein